jgi:hypothetical protein
MFEYMYELRSGSVIFPVDRCCYVFSQLLCMPKAFDFCWFFSLKLKFTAVVSIVEILAHFELKV